MGAGVRRHLRRLPGERRGDVKTCWKPFHDAFLAFGGPPIPLVRGAMMKEAPKAVF